VIGLFFATDGSCEPYETVSIATSRSSLAKLLCQARPVYKSSCADIRSTRLRSFSMRGSESIKGGFPQLVLAAKRTLAGTSTAWQASTGITSGNSRRILSYVQSTIEGPGEITLTLLIMTQK